MNGCELCESDIDFIEVSLEDRFTQNPDAEPEKQKTDYLKMCRRLESEYDIGVSVTKMKEHLNEHVRFSLSSPEP